MKQYFYLKNDIKNGPISFEQITELNLEEDTLIWRIGLANWIPIKDLPEYKEYLPPPIPSIISIERETHSSSNGDLENVQNDLIEKLSIGTNESTQNKRKFGGFFIRFLAFLIDFLILLFFTTFVWAIFQIPINSGTETFLTDKIFIFKNPLSILFGWLYYASFECSKFQATPGKAIVGVSITDERYLRIDFAKSSGRYFSKLLSAFIIGIGFIMIMFSKKKQSLHDRLVGTYVLKAQNTSGLKMSWGILLSTFILFIMALFIPANLVNHPVLDNNVRIKTKTEGIKTDPTLLSYSYAGLSLKYPSNWVVGGKELKKQISYQINLRNQVENANEIMSITILNLKSDSYEMIQNAIKSMSNEKAYQNATIKEITNLTFNGMKAFSADFEVSLLGDKYFGNMKSFGNDEKTILILKQTYSLGKLEISFKAIEESIFLE